MFNSMEAFTKSWIQIRKPPSRKPTQQEIDRLEGVEDLYNGWLLVKANQTLRDSKQLADIQMSRDSSKIRR